MNQLAQSLLEKIERRYNPENDCPTGQPLVTWTDYALLEIIKQQQAQIDALERSLRAIHDIHP